MEFQIITYPVPDGAPLPDAAGLPPIGLPPTGTAVPGLGGMFVPAGGGTT